MMVAFVCLACDRIWWLAHRPVFDLHRHRDRAGRRAASSSTSAPRRCAPPAWHGFSGNFFTVDLDRRARSRFEDAPWVRRAAGAAGLAEPARSSRSRSTGRSRTGATAASSTPSASCSASIRPRSTSASRCCEFAGPEGTQGIVTAPLRGTDRAAASRVAMTPHEVSAVGPPGLVGAARQRHHAADRPRRGRRRQRPRSRAGSRSIPMVQARLNERTEVIDLRYPNGFAVRAPGVLIRKPT